MEPGRPRPISSATRTIRWDTSKSATGGGTSWSDDGFGNVTKGSSAQTYKIINNQAKVTSTLSVSDVGHLGSTSGSTDTALAGLETDWIARLPRCVDEPSGNDRFQQL